MKKVIALLLAIVMLLSFTAFAANAKGTLELTITLNSINIDGMEGIEDAALTIKVTPDGDSFAAEATLTAEGQSLTAFITMIDGQIAFAVPSYSGEVYVVDSELIKDAINTPDMDKQQELIADLMNTDIAENTVEFVQQIAQVLGGIGDSITESEGEFVLEGLDKAVNCNIVTVEPTEETWKSTLTELLKTVKSNDELENIIEDISRTVFKTGVVTQFEDAETMTDTICDMIDNQCAELLEGVDSMASALSTCKLEVAYSDDMFYGIKVTVGESVLAYAIDTEEKTTKSALTADGAVVFTTERTNTSDSISGNVNSDAVEFKMDYDFSKKSSSELGIPYGGAKIAIPGVELSADISKTDRGSAHTIALADGDEKLELKVESAYISEAVTFPQGSKTTISSTAEFEALIKDILNSVAAPAEPVAPVIAEPAATAAPEVSTGKTSLGNSLGGKLKQKTTLPTKAMENDEFVVTCDEFKEMFLNAVKNELAGNYPDTESSDGIMIQEMDGFFYIVTNAWEAPIFEIYFYNGDEEVSGDSTFTDVCLMYYEEGVIDSDLGVDCFFDYIDAIIYLCNPNASSYEDCEDIAGQLLDTLEDYEDGTGRWSGLSDNGTAYYVSVDWYEDESSAYYFSIWEFEE